jgi:hypothetical protein
MPLTKQDLSAVGRLVDTKLNTLDSKLASLKRDIFDRMDSRFTADGKRFDNIDARLRGARSKGFLS